MITQSSSKYWDENVDGFDAIYSGAGRTLIGRRLDAWLRKDIYLRLVETTRLVNELGESQTILDIGTGTGRLCVPLARAGHRVIGVDFSSEMLDKADRVTREAGIRDRCHFVQGDVLGDLDNTLRDYGPFDAVTILGVFDYISDPLPALQAARQYDPKRMIASFPRNGTLRSVLRQWRYRVQGLDCPLYFYSKDQIEMFARTLESPRTSNVIIGQLHLTCFDWS